MELQGTNRTIANVRISAEWPAIPRTSGQPNLRRSLTIAAMTLTRKILSSTIYLVILTPFTKLREMTKSLAMSRKMVRQFFEIAKPTDVEFIAILGLALWNDGEVYRASLFIDHSQIRWIRLKISRKSRGAFDRRCWENCTCTMNSRAQLTTRRESVISSVCSSIVR